MQRTVTKETTRLKQVEELFRESPPFRQLTDRLAAEPNAWVTVSGLAGSADALMLKSLIHETGRPVLVLTERAEDAADLYDDLCVLMGTERVGHFPSRQILPYDFRAPVGEVMGRRITSLAGLQDSFTSIVVAPIRAALEPTIPAEELKASSLRVKTGDEIELDDLVNRLVRLGFRRVPLVEEVGDFSLRGGLVDFFTPGSSRPVRVELFGNEVDTIRTFDVTTQRTVSKLNEVSVLPKREVPITQETLESYLEALPEDDADYIRHRYLNDPDLPGLEWLAVTFGLKSGSLVDYLSPETLVYALGLGSLKAEADAVLKEAENLRERFVARLKSLPQPEEYYTSPEKLFERLDRFSGIDCVPFRGGKAGGVHFGCQPHPSFGSRLDLLAKQVQEFNASGVTHFIATDRATQAERMRDLLEEKTELATAPDIEVANLRGGFVYPSARIAVLTDHEIFGRYHRRVRKKKYKEGVAVSDYTSLNRGDFVVHTDYGIARYLGLKTLTVDGRNRDCLELTYAENDKLFVPIEEFNRVSKYAGKDSAPSLTNLSGQGWEKLKKKTSKAIEKMAAELLELYARRESGQGHSFGDDTVWLKQLEASFPYQETPDQAKAITDVKRDMGSQRPMDRLVCGDVGYGKTEVAVRAAFKAIDGGKQVAILVPTTVLAQQHFVTFSERMADFPVKIALLSRFRTRAQQRETVEQLAEGKVDLVIGTHRLLSKDVVFRDLGLLVIDEEHRFGVRHKEKLRQLRATVDTLSLTATPIPRTLQMSLIGVRDMSVIATSPKDRLPISTEIIEFDPAMIATAILREMNRGGQVFFVHNRVQTIEAMHRYIKKLVPQAEIAIAHGQMHERSLEGIMLAYLTGRFDVLLCTSIIESGLDIPNANTMIVNRADRFGLAQLYQIRGRVGRSARRAYAYLVAPPARMLRADAVKRLRALEAHADLGSGFALAMRDLEIRGAGTVLGSRQSGYIEEVGFDMYNRLLEEAVSKLKGQEVIPLPQTSIESDLEMFLPESYVNDRQQKVDIYRRLAGARTLDVVEQIRDEVTDRYGRPPQSAVNLFDGTAVKVSASALEIEKVTLRNGRACLFFNSDRKLQRAEVEALRRVVDQPMEFYLTGAPRVELDLGQVNVDRRMEYLRGALGRL